MVSVDLFVILLPTVVSIGTIIFSFGMLYQRVKSMDQSLKVMNHNSTAMMKSLLRRGVLEPADLEGL